MLCHKQPNGQLPSTCAYGFFSMSFLPLSNVALSENKLLSRSAFLSAKTVTNARLICGREGRLAGKCQHLLEETKEQAKLLTSSGTWVRWPCARPPVFARCHSNVSTVRKRLNLENADKRCWAHCPCIASLWSWFRSIQTSTLSCVDV